VGSGQPLVTQRILHGIIVDVPSCPEYRQKIAKVLSILDAKIELNNRINAELEGMAKLLYDYWFVQFDFPMTAAQAAALGRPALAGHPYKSSGGKMVPNPTLNRPIPEGWEAGTLLHFISNDKTGDWGQDEPTGNYTERVTCIRGTDLNALNGAGLMEPPIRYILKKNLIKRLLPNDVIIEISGGSPKQSTGRAGLITGHTLERFNGPLICSNFCKAISIRKETWSHYFLQSWKRLYDNGVLFSWEGKTSGIKNLLFDSFVQHHKIAIPPDDLMGRFHAVLEPQHAQRQKLLIQNQELTQLRDWLLPLLMNGQVTVGA
jgi:type I restriction enzyme S subunit